MRSIHDNLQAVRQRISEAAKAAGRDARDVTLLAVSKTQPAGAITQALAAGQRAFGENYVQEALEKMDAIASSAQGPDWHLIGPLQSNKTRVVAERFDWVQSIDSEKIARRLSEQRPDGLAALNVLIQTNVSCDGSYSGVAPTDVSSLDEEMKALPNLRLRGLMAIPEPGAPRARYAELHALYEKLKPEFGFDTLSVGMSDDMELAIAEGATMVRVGTAIFGQRQNVRSAA